MNNALPDKPMSDIQGAADLLIEMASNEEQGPSALDVLSAAILEYCDEEITSAPSQRLFSPELSLDTQRLSAVWLVWALSQNRGSLAFEDTERLTALLCDRTLANFYPAGITTRNQTFEKLLALEQAATSLLDEARRIVDQGRHLDQVDALRNSWLRFLRQDRNALFLRHLLPWQLVDNATQRLLNTVVEYVQTRDDRSTVAFDSALQLCNEYKQQAAQYNTTVSDEILVALADNLLSAITEEEEKSRPHLRSSAMDKRYPLTERDVELDFYITVENTGTGPAREVKLETICTEPSLSLVANPDPILTFRPGDSAELRVRGTVNRPSDKIDLQLRLSWRRNNGLEEHQDITCTFYAQKDDVDWGQIKFEQPYDHTAPVMSPDNLYGREAELIKLVRTAGVASVGSAYLYGQKRVGKTSLANTFAQKLRLAGQQNGADWLVIYVGSGDYLMGDAVSTLNELGQFLVRQVQREVERRIPDIALPPVPDFSNGIAPLSAFINYVMDKIAEPAFRILFILDEFDELPIEFLRRTPLASALFQPIREISSKPGCGFLLVGGENMQQLMVLQGDRLNKFEAIRIDYLDRPEFSDLIREPVKHWLSITPEALEILYQSCSGNPYYGKLLAAELLDVMVARQDSDASRKEVEVAIGRKIKDIGANSFAHFWMDGILPDDDELEKIQTARRFVLAATGQVLRDEQALTRSQIVEKAKQSRDRTLMDADFYAALDDLTSRDIIRTAGDDVEVKMPIFRDWLIETGGDVILPDSIQRLYLSRRQEAVDRDRVSDDEIFNLCSQFENAGRKIETAIVRKWLSEFDNSRDQRLMLELLQGVNIYGRGRIREKMREAFGIIQRDMPTAEVVGGYPSHRGILVSCLDESPAKGGPVVCRLFVGENNLNSDSSVFIDELGNAITRRRKVQRLVLIDDFMGTGNTMLRGMSDHLETLKRANSRGIRIILLAVAGFAGARTMINEFIESQGLDAVVHLCDELGEEYKAFSDRSRVFPVPSDRVRAKEVSERKGVALFPEHPLGYQDGQALIAFADHCPNNALPILWSKKNGWPTLFPRLGE